MRVCEDYAGTFMTATALATILKETGRKELTATIKGVRLHEFKKGEKPKYVLSFVGKSHGGGGQQDQRLCPRQRPWRRSDNWPGNKVVLSTSFGQTPNGMGHIMHMRGVVVGEQPRVAAPSQGAKSAQGNGAGNAYAAASQPANGQPPEQGISASADLNDEIPF